MSAPFRPLKKEDVADVLGVSVRTVENWVDDGLLIAPKKLGNRVYWHPAAFYGWLEQRVTEECAAEAANESSGQSLPAATVPRRERRNAEGKSKTGAQQLHARDEAQFRALLA